MLGHMRGTAGFALATFLLVWAVCFTMALVWVEDSRLAVRLRVSYQMHMDAFYAALAGLVQAEAVVQGRPAPPFSGAGVVSYQIVHQTVTVDGGIACVLNAVGQKNQASVQLSEQCLFAHQQRRCVFWERKV